MPLKTPTLAVLATLVVVLFTYQYLASTPGDLDTYIPLSPNSAKFGSEVPGLNSNIQDAQDLDWDDLPEGGGELLSGEAGASEQRRVKVDLGVMSRCPDARLCESVMDKVFSYPGVREKIDVRLNYIGRPDAKETYGVRCMHGDRECAGNIHQLCMQRHTFNSTFSPPSSTADEPYISSSSLPPYWSFTLAQNFIDSSRTGDLDYAKQCAKAVGVNWEESGVAGCVGEAGANDATSGGKEGQALLLESVERLIDLDVTKSCTILLEGKIRCVHDGSWKNCDDGHEILDFVHSIDREYERLQS
ncbi:hypothetical protein NCC49_002389 [Naganishia albida]|nr:hypothetical protein NCC49_002389 [Naganishia albida]